VLGRLHEDIVHAKGTGKKAGEFYTPPFVADYMISLMEFDSDDTLGNRKFIDIACGTGAFVVAGARRAIRSLMTRGVSGRDALKSVAAGFYGLDISRTAIDICKINLYLVLLNDLGPEVLSRSGKLQFNVFRADSVDNRDTCNNDDRRAIPIKHRAGKYAGGFDYVLGNPPYLEAKKMPEQLKEACRESWPVLTGAFDLYVPFIMQCNRMVAEDGKVCLVLPDKFTVAKYGTGLRDKLLSDFSLMEIVDLSGMDVFSRAMVYPTVIAYKNDRPSPGHMVRTRMSVGSATELVDRAGHAAVPQSLYRTVGQNKTLFCVPAHGDMAAMLQRIFSEGTSISHFVDFRSAVSFHKKGLRELFVRRSFDNAAGPVLKYLGGRSFSRKNEVDLFSFRWDGYHIDYDRTSLKDHGNMLPPLANFLQEKIVLCQHAPRITAAYDGNGEFVTKDVYPIGIAAPGLARSPLSLRYFSALLNSELMSFVYGTIYKGIQIGGGYYHYLPTWIGVLPVIVPEASDIRKIESLSGRMSATDSREKKIRWMGEADTLFYRIYGTSKGQQAIMKKTVPAWKPEK